MFLVLGPNHSMLQAAKTNGNKESFLMELSMLRICWDYAEEANIFVDKKLLFRHYD